MKTITFKNFGSKGLNSDILETDHAFLTSGNNFKCRNGRVITTHDFQQFDTVDPALKCGAILEHFDKSLIITHSAGIINNGLSVLTVAAVDESLWTLTAFGQFTIANHPTAGIFYKSDANFIEMPWAVAEVFLQKQHTVRSFNNIIFCLSIVDDANAFTWSHPADNSGLPYSFDYDGSDLSSLAGYAQIANGGKIVDGLQLGDSFIIYSENAINTLNFTGGELVFNRREISSTVGLLSKDCVVEVNNKHYFISSDGDLKVFDGNNITSIFNNKIQDDFQQSLSSDYYTNTKLIHNIIDNEISIAVSIESDCINKLFTYNYIENTVSKRDLPILTTSIAYSSEFINEATYDATDVTFNSAIQVFNSSTNTPLSHHIVIISDNNVMKSSDNNIVDESTNFIIEKLYFQLTDSAKNVQINECYLDILGEPFQTVSVQFGTAKSHDSAISWKPAYSYEIGKTRKIDMRSSGLFHCFRLSSNDAQHFEIAGLSLNISENIASR